MDYCINDEIEHHHERSWKNLLGGEVFRFLGSDEVLMKQYGEDRFIKMSDGSIHLTNSSTPVMTLVPSGGLKFVRNLNYQNAKEQ